MINIKWINNVFNIIHGKHFGTIIYQKFNKKKYLNFLM